MVGSSIREKKAELAEQVGPGAKVNVWSQPEWVFEVKCRTCREWRHTPAAYVGPGWKIRDPKLSTAVLCWQEHERSQWHRDCLQAMAGS